MNKGMASSEKDEEILRNHGKGKELKSLSLSVQS